MFNLLLAIVSSTLVSVMMRIGEGRAKNNISMLSVNYFICLVLSFFYTGMDNLFQSGEGVSTAISLGSINGIFYIVSLILFQNSIRKNGVVLSSIFMKLGIMMPLIISIVLFKEMPNVFQVIGFVIALTAIIMINLKEPTGRLEIKDLKRKNQGKVSLIFVLIGCGMADGMSKIYQELGTEQFEELFLVFTFVIAFVLSIILVVYKKQKFTINEFIYGALLGLPNYYSARFLLKALGEIPAVVAYPTFSIGTIAVITITGIIIFKEKITRMQMFAVGLIAIAVVMLN